MVPPSNEKHSSFILEHCLTLNMKFSIVATSILFAIASVSAQILCAFVMPLSLTDHSCRGDEMVDNLAARDFLEGGEPSEELFARQLDDREIHSDAAINLALRTLEHVRRVTLDHVRPTFIL
jgi:hypothetical protein